MWKRATQTVFGEGIVGADVMFVGEQPGNDEDLAGRPFVGPAGRVLNDALEQAGIGRHRSYKPRASEIGACRPWLDAEIAAVHPRVIVCLGATAARALLGSSFKVSMDRGRFVTSPLAPFVTATVHPSSILREPDPIARRQAMQAFVSDLRKVRAKL